MSMLTKALALTLFLSPPLSAQRTAKNLPGAQWINLPSEVAASHLVKKAAVAYPPFARAAGIQEAVQVGVAIDPDGRVQIYSGGPAGWACLWQAAMDAAARYVCSPFKKDGHPVGVHTTEEIIFKLPPGTPIFQPPPSPRLTLDILSDFDDATRVSEGPPELRKWLLAELRKDFDYSFWDKQGGFKGVQDALPAEMVEIPTQVPGSRLFIISDGVVSPAQGQAVLCGATGNCDIWLVEDDGGTVRHSVRDGGFGFYVRQRKGAPYPDIFTVGNMSAAESDVTGYVNIKGHWGVLYCGKILGDKSDIHLCR